MSEEYTAPYNCRDAVSRYRDHLNRWLDYIASRPASEIAAIIAERRRQLSELGMVQDIDPAGATKFPSGKIPREFGQ